jgi:hypothetical protein
MGTADRPLHRSCPPIYPTGCTKAVTNARPCTTAHRLRLPVLLPAPLWQRSAREGGTTGRVRSVRHHRHVAGRVARGKAVGRRATTRRIGLRVMPQRQRRQNDERKRPATGRWRTNKRQRVDAALAADTDSCPNGAGVSCKGRDSVRSTWRGNCRTLVQ